MPSEQVTARMPLRHWSMRLICPCLSQTSAATTGRKLVARTVAADAAIVAAMSAATRLCRIAGITFLLAPCAAAP